MQNNKAQFIEYDDDDNYDYEYDPEDKCNYDKYNYVENRPGEDYYSKCSGLKILIVAEKNSIAVAISTALSQGSVVTRGAGRPTCYYFTGEFRGKRANFIVTSSNGHIFNLDFPRKFSDRSKLNPLELFQSQTVKRPVNQQSMRQLQIAANDCDHLLLWLDDDREGENICFEVKQICRPYLKKGFETIRAHFSSIAHRDLLKTFRDMSDEIPSLLEAKAVDARQIIDLKIGVVFSRFQTQHINNKYPALRNEEITYGPCQTPILGFCVDRLEEIQRFKIQTYYEIKLYLQGQRGQITNAKLEGERIFNEQDAQKLVAYLKQFKKFEVVETSFQNIEIQRPEGLNTIKLLQYASSSLGIGPKKALQVAQLLYLKGFITYPRTETTQFTESLETKLIIKNLSSQYVNNDISEYATKLKKNGHRAPVQGKQFGDHPPITPTILVPQYDLSGDIKKIYEYVVRMFLAAHSVDFLYIQSTLRVKPADIDVTFKATGIDIVNQGFATIASWLAQEDDYFDHNDYIVKDQVLVASIAYQQAETTPPDYLSESELIGLMEKKRIGTDASIASHIDKICQRNYVSVDLKDRVLIPTVMGQCLVRGYRLIDAYLVDSDLRANIEFQCDMIAQGKAEFEIVVDKIINTFERKFYHFEKNIIALDDMLSANIGLIKEEKVKRERQRVKQRRQKGGRRR